MAVESSFEPSFREMLSKPAPADTILLSDDGSEAESSELEDGSDDEDVPRPGVKQIGISKYYVPSWTTEDAFRELYQNWKDAIIASFNLDPRSFRPVFKETPTQIHITIHREPVEEGDQASRELLGFIRFNRKAGSVELTNFQAELKRKNLLMGLSTKRGHDVFAGCHGEGFKLAAMVLRREGHSVRFAASEYYWNFGLRGRDRSYLACRLSRAKVEAVEKKKRDFAARSAKPKFRRGLTSNIWEDVTVRVGKAKGDWGVFVSEEDFRSWLTVAIDLNPPSPTDVVQTAAGDLILDARFEGHIYLKGLRIVGHGTDFAHGYNLARGTIGRDRDRLKTSAEEDEILNAIWEQAILTRGPDAVDTYIKLVHDREGCPEVGLTGQKLPKSAVLVIWARLRTLNPNTFFYPKGGPSQLPAIDQVNLITDELNKVPVAVPSALWKLLKKFSLVRTPQEERNVVFMASKEVVLDRDAFGAHIVRALKASLALHPKLRDWDLRFVDGGGTDVEIVFNSGEKQVLVHAKWLQFQTAHRRGSCEVLRLTDDGQLGGEAFFCDHVVEDLFESLLGVSGRGQRTLLRRRMRELLRLMPRLVQVTPTESPNELEVRWIGNEGGLVSTYYNRHIRYLVILHRLTSCQSRSNDLLHKYRTESPVANAAPSQSESDSRTESVVCDCPAQIVPRSLSRAVFTGLDHNEQYFPMVARFDDYSFFATPPIPVAPLGIVAPSFSGPSDGGHPDLATEGVDFNNVPDICEDRHATDQYKEGVQWEAPEIDVKPPVTDFETQNPPTSQPPSLRGIESIPEEVDALPLFERDQDYWRQWHAEELPRAFSKLLAHREGNGLRTLHPVAGLEWPDLDFEFVKGEYALIRIGRENPSEHVIFIHEISYCAEEPEISSASLLVTRYSKLVSTYPVRQQLVGEDEDEDEIEKCRELLLHFGDFGNMGTRHDAELIRLNDVVYATDLTAGVDHVLTPPSAFEHDAMYCRFAIQGSTSNGPVACWTPLSSDLLSRRDRWRGRQFNNVSKPAVVDFTPGILGAAEGFSQAGFDIRAAMGFDHERHLSWKIRHAQSQVYDGSPRDTLDDIDSKRLRLPWTSEPAPPKLALVAGGNSPFRLSEANQKMPSIEQFVSQLDLLDAAFKSPGKPDFLVMLCSPAMLHQSVVPRLIVAILNLLEHRLSVHMKLCHLQDHGLPLRRSIFIMIASPFCAPLPWCLHSPSVPSSLGAPSTTLGDLIVDLAFENPRAGLGPLQRAFVCSPPLDMHNGNVPQAERYASHVYNHQTGQESASSWRVPLAWETDVLVGLSCDPQPWTHPVRQDLLTVRELARLQGFPDDFVFYQSLAIQYQDVWTALPPIVTRLVGKTILQVIQGSLRAKAGDRQENLRASKRPRSESEV